MENQIPQPSLDSGTAPEEADRSAQRGLVGKDLFPQCGRGYNRGMTPDWIIATKRDGKELSRAEIDWAIEHFRTGEFRDYQMAALAMAIYLRGMSAEETTALTEAMLASGSRLTWRDLPGPVVDKHSDGRGGR